MKKFTSKDVVFLAILSVVLLILSSLIMPVVMFTNITALRQLFAAPIFAIFSVIAIKKVPKIGTLSIVGFLTGGVLLFMSTIMFINNFFGAVIVETFILLTFKNYEKDTAIITSCALYMPVTLPLSLLSQTIMKNKNLSQLTGSKFETIFLPLAVIALSITGAFIGLKISKELKKTGKL